MNQTGLSDADGEIEDWIELVNTSGEWMDLGGFSLSNDPDELDMWIFPSRSIPPGGHLIVFASGKNRISSELHTNFKLESENARIILGDDFDEVLDEIVTQRMLADISRGRDASSPENWVYFREPTPGEINETQSYDGISSAPSFSVAPGLCDQPFSLELEGEGRSAWHSVESSPRRARLFMRARSSSTIQALFERGDSHRE